MIETLAQNIFMMRAKYHMSQAELARRLEVSRSSVNAWEIGVATPQLRHVIEMANIFKTTVDGMLNLSSSVMIDISDLSEKEQQAVFNIVDCIKNKYNEDSQP